MKVQAEVSLYTLRTSKLSGPVAEFCQVLRSRGLYVETRSMSTFIVGESERLFEALKEGFEVSARRNDTVMNIRISNGCPTTVGQKATGKERVD